MGFSKRSIGIISLAAVVALISGGVFLALYTQEPVPVGTHYSSHAAAHFYGDVDPIGVVPQEQARGAIVSHHLLVADDIARTIKSLRQPYVPVVVIVGPDHFSRKHGGVSVSRYGFETPWGRIDPDTDLVDAIVDARLATQNEYVFEMEHSIASVVPYIRYNFPDTKLVAITLERSIAKERIVALATFLNEELPEGSIVIASVDFSHHLDVTAANFHDAKSVAAIAAFDFASIDSLEIDSPDSIRLLLTYLEKKGAQAITATTTNSAIVQATPYSEDVTSYLFATFAPGVPAQWSVGISLHVGDTMLGRDIETAVSQGVDLFEYIRGPEGNFLRGMDMIVANLEGPITSVTQCAQKEVVFRFMPGAENYLQRAPVTHLTLANNHTLDCGEEGMRETQELLEAAGLVHFGGGSLKENTRTETKGGMTIALVGIDQTLPSIPEEDIFQYLQTLEASHDYTIVHVHWGSEYQSQPSQAQQALAHRMIDSGADAIIGHHPHVVQPLEIYHNRPIFYSLGNFIFDQQGIEVTTGIGVGLHFEPNRIAGYIFPFTANRKYQPVRMKPSDAHEYCARINPLHETSSDPCTVTLEL